QRVPGFRPNATCADHQRLALGVNIQNTSSVASVWCVFPNPSVNLPEWLSGSIDQLGVFDRKERNRAAALSFKREGVHRSQKGNHRTLFITTLQLMEQRKDVPKNLTRLLRFQRIPLELSGS